MAARKMPRQKPGKSKQDYGTPDDFIRAVEARWGPLDIDLAARKDNSVAPECITPEEDTLKTPWIPRIAGMNAFLNPEFADIEPYAAKCSAIGPHMLGGRIIMLTPASVGSAWFRRHVHRKAMVIALGHRMIFKGTPPNPKTGKPDAYPKDLMLSVFGPGLAGFDVWPWKEER